MTRRFFEKVCLLGCSEKVCIFPPIPPFVPKTRKPSSIEIGEIACSTFTWCILTCVASVSVQFRSKERGTGVNDRKPNGNACYSG